MSETDKGGVFSNACTSDAVDSSIDLSEEVFALDGSVWYLNYSFVRSSSPRMAAAKNIRISQLS